MSPIDCFPKTGHRESNQSQKNEHFHCDTTASTSNTQKHCHFRRASSILEIDLKSRYENEISQSSILHDKFKNKSNSTVIEEEDDCIKIIEFLTKKLAKLTFIKFGLIFIVFFLLITITLKIYSQLSNIVLTASNLIV